jgi:hypothetical protein
MYVFGFALTLFRTLFKYLGEMGNERGDLIFLDNLPT